MGHGEALPICTREILALPRPQAPPRTGPHGEQRRPWESGAISAQREQGLQSTDGISATNPCPAGRASCGRRKLPQIRAPPALSPFPTLVPLL